MNLIVNVNKRWYIGKNGGLIYSIPDDMRFFKQTTSGKTVVMGRATLDSLPGGKPLKNRKNVVLTHNPPQEADGVIYCSCMSELVNLIKNESADDVFVIGGGMLYKLLLPYCKNAFVTYVYDDAEGDVRFPDLSAAPEWSLKTVSELKEHNGTKYEFRVYENNEIADF